MTGLGSPALWCAAILGLCALLCLRGLVGRLMRLALRSGAGLALLAALARFGSASSMFISCRYFCISFSLRNLFICNLLIRTRSSIFFVSLII